MTGACVEVGAPGMDPAHTGAGCVTASRARAGEADAMTATNTGAASAHRPRGLRLTSDAWLNRTSRVSICTWRRQMTGAAANPPIKARRAAKAASAHCGAGRVIGPRPADTDEGGAAGRPVEMPPLAVLWYPLPVGTGGVVVWVSVPVCGVAALPVTALAGGGTVVATG